MPIFTGGLIENQVKEASAQEAAASAQSLNIEQALTQQVTNAYLDTVTFAQQIKRGEEQVKTAQEALSLAKQRYKLGLGTVVEVTQSEVAVTGAQTRLAEAQYDYKISEVTLAYASPRKLCAVARGIGRGIATHFGETLSIRESSCMHRGAPACIISFRVVTPES